jgi:hypothetical protein
MPGDFGAERVSVPAGIVTDSAPSFFDGSDRGTVVKEDDSGAGSM